MSLSNLFHPNNYTIYAHSFIPSSTLTVDDLVVENSEQLNFLNTNQILTTDSSKFVVGKTLTDGQILIGDTGGTPIPANLTSTDSSVVITNGPGSINLAVGSVIPGNCDFTGTVTMNGPLIVNDSEQLNFLSANQILTTDATKHITGNTLTNGQLLIGNTGATPTAATLTTPNSTMTITNGTGSIGLDLAATVPGNHTWTGTNAFNNTLSTTGVFSDTNTTDVTIAGANGAIRNSGGESISKSLFVGGTLFVADIQARSGQHLTIQPNGNCNIIPAAKLTLESRNSDGMALFGTTTGDMSFSFGKTASTVDWTLGISNNANSYVNGSAIRDLIIQPQVSTQKLWVGISANQYASIGNSGTVIYPADDASSTTTGAFVVTGGAGIGKKLYVGTGIILPIGGGSQLDTYTKNSTTSITPTGFSVNVATTFTFSMIGNQVTMSYPNNLNGFPGGTQAVFTAAVPSAMRPSTTIIFRVFCLEVGIMIGGVLLIDSTGTLTFGKDNGTPGTGGNFNSGIGGIYATSISWLAGI